MTPRGSPDVEDRLLGALAVLRVVLLANVVVVTAWRAETMVRPALGWACVGVVAAWTAVATWAYAEPRRRGRLLLGADLALAVVLLLLSPLVRGGGFETSVPGFWVMAALLAWAVCLHEVGGLLAGLALAAADVSVRTGLTQANYGNLFLLLIGGPIVGYLCASLQQMQRQRDRAERAAAAAAERARLARAVHDGVLQVLALVQRRGAELGGEAAGLGRLAGEQEAALRTLVHQQDAAAPAASRPAGGPPGGPVEPVDLVAAVAGLGTRAQTSVAVPAGTCPVPAGWAHEVLAALGACLDNVERHVGPGAPAWVLLQVLGDRVEVTVRDAGPGIAPGRLAEAQAQGRMGVSGSVRGRVRDLGGSAEVRSGPEGTEWELVVPLPAAATAPAPRSGRWPRMGA